MDIVTEVLKNSKVACLAIIKAAKSNHDRRDIQVAVRNQNAEVDLHELFLPGPRRLRAKCRVTVRTQCRLEFMSLGQPCTVKANLFCCNRY